MALDLTSTALQIDQMAQHLKARQSDRQRRLQAALDAIRRLDVDEYERRRQAAGAGFAWQAPAVIEAQDRSYPPPAVPTDFCVVAADGSHIDVDRHLPVRCFVINIGVSVLRYGSTPDAELYSRPRLYAEDDELVIRDRQTPYREQAIEGSILGIMRSVEELKALAEVVRELPEDIPTLAMMDGTLIMFGLIGQNVQEFVIRQLIEEEYADALEAMRQMALRRPLALASYISLPNSTEVVNGLRLMVCPFDVPECQRNCGARASGQRPCDLEVGGLRDRDVFAELLGPGERSGMFATSSPLVQRHYGGHGVSFFYVNAGAEIGRVEVPSWVGDDETLLGLAHALAIDQCRRGPGYPVALMEAHEQAVITGADRRYFVELVENALYDQRLPVYSSEKNRSKRLRWV